MGLMITKMLSICMLLTTFTILAGASSVVANSSVITQTTNVPLAYRAIVGIILIVISVFAIWKFFKIFIGAIFAFIILAIILSTAYYFMISGTFSIHNSLAFLEYIWEFFSGKITFLKTIPTTIGSISNITGINGITANVIGLGKFA